jgi:hypothetical protein
MECTHSIPLFCYDGVYLNPRYSDDYSLTANTHAHKQPLSTDQETSAECASASPKPRPAVTGQGLEHESDSTVITDRFQRSSGLLSPVPNDRYDPALSAPAGRKTNPHIHNQQNPRS